MRPAPALAAAALAALAALAIASNVQADPVADRAEGRRLLGERKWAEAAAVYRKLTGANPDMGADWYFLGISLARIDCKAARPALERAIALGATGSAGSLRQAHLDAAGCAAEAGDRAAAFAHLRVAQGRLGYSDFAALARDESFAPLLRDPEWGRLAGTASPGLDRVQGWRQDLAWFTELLVRRHPHPFHAVSEAEWRAEAARLEADIPGLDDLQVTLRFMRLASLIGDGHTVVYPPFEGPRAFHMLPVWPYRLGDDWYVLAAAPGREDLVGARIVGVGGRPIGEAVRRLADLVPSDNPASLAWITAVALQFAEVAGDGAGPVALDLVTTDGRRRSVALQPGAVDRDPTTPWAPEGWPRMGQDRTPLWLSRPNEPQWMEPIEEPHALFVQVNQIRESEPGGFRRFAEAVGERLRREPDRVLIIDLRHDNGGSGALNWALVREVIRCGCDRPGGVFVITGRRTFSAAQTLASLLETRTEAIFVGEPTGSRPNFNGEDTDFTLPWSGLKGSISSAWFQGGETSFDERPWIAPDLPAPLTAGDLLAGRDPALDAIAAHLRARPH
ncbi:MAG: hypothetical protein K1X35_05095 [Caulobacteraceae bacterium]|nr:hypothetical protein [Caulobacteraceae bacterium]